MPTEKFSQFSLEEDLDKVGPRHPDREDLEDLTPEQTASEEIEFPLPESLQEIENEKEAQRAVDELLRKEEDGKTEKLVEQQEKLTWQKKLDEAYGGPPDPMGEIDPLRSRKRRK
jgi:hypothetical protein